jgi:membrane protein
MVRNFLTLFKKAYDKWSAHNVPRFGAALAYYSIFAIAPLLIIAIAVGGLIFGESAARSGLQGELSDTLGAPVAKAMQDILKSSNENPGEGVTATIFGFIVLLIGAGGVFAQLRDALNVIFKAPPEPSTGIWQTLRTQFFSVAMVLGSGFLLLVSLIINTVLSALGKWMSDSLPGSTYLWQVVNNVVSFAVVAGLFALIYRYVPNTRMKWRSVWIGAIVTAGLFTLGKFVLGWYLGRAGTTSSYGAAASLVVILIWVYYASQIMLYGAAFTRVHSDQMRGDDAPEKRIETPAADRRQVAAEVDKPMVYTEKK